jgi:hypothetical protein
VSRFTRCSWACDVLALITTASAIETDIHRARAGSEAETAARLTKAFSALSAERFPQIAAHSFELTTGDRDARFQFAIDVFLDGLVARAARD